MNKKQAAGTPKKGAAGAKKGSTGKKKLVIKNKSPGSGADQRLALGPKLEELSDLPRDMRPTVDASYVPYTLSTPKPAASLPLPSRLCLVGLDAPNRSIRTRCR